MSAPLSSLLVRWEVAEEQGRPLAPEQLCADHPDLVEPLAEVIARLRQLRRLLRAAGSAEAFPPTLDPSGKPQPLLLACDLLLRWEQSREQGRELPPEELCPGPAEVHEAL